MVFCLMHDYSLFGNDCLHIEENIRRSKVNVRFNISPPSQVGRLKDKVIYAENEQLNFLYTHRQVLVIAIEKYPNLKIVTLSTCIFIF